MAVIIFPKAVFPVPLSPIIILTLLYKKLGLSGNDTYPTCELDISSGHA